jgi:hypothetical protein
MRPLYEQAKLALASITEYVEKQGFEVTEDWNKIKLKKDGQFLGVVECVGFRSRIHPKPLLRYRVEGKRVPTKARYRSGGARTYSKVLSVCDAIDKFFVPYSDDELQMKLLKHGRSVRDTLLRDARDRMNSARLSLAELLFQREMHGQHATKLIVEAKGDYRKAVDAVEDAEAAWDTKNTEIKECQERIDNAV